MAVVEMGSVACTSGILFRFVLSAVNTSREKSVCPLDIRDPTIVFTGAFHKSGIMSYSFVGGNDSTWVSARFTCDGLFLKGLLLLLLLLLLLFLKGLLLLLLLRLLLL